MSTANKKRLGRGLAALLSAEGQDGQQIEGFLPALDIESVTPNPKQPRLHIEPQDLIGLADSIREYGIIEPLIVTKLPTGKYQLIAGERRWRAAKLAQLQTVPAVIKEASPRQVLEMAIIENIQRKDLTAIEEATAIHELYSTHRVTLQELSKKVGKEVSTLSNKMRLLKLPIKVQESIMKGLIGEAHAYVLLTLKSKDALLAAHSVVAKKGLSVRQTEELVRKIGLANQDVLPKKQRKHSVIYDEYTAKLETDLGSLLGKGFRLIRKRDGGHITIPFQSPEQLQALYEYLTSKDFPAKV